MLSAFGGNTVCGSCAVPMMTVPPPTLPSPTRYLERSDTTPRAAHIWRLIDLAVTERRRDGRSLAVHFTDR
jgi:hypothetical protein